MQSSCLLARYASGREEEVTDGNLQQINCLTDGMVIVRYLWSRGLYAPGIRMGCQQHHSWCKEPFNQVNTEDRGITSLTAVVTIKVPFLREYCMASTAELWNITITENQVATAEIPANTIFLDIWLPADRSYGGGIPLGRKRQQYCW